MHPSLEEKRTVKFQCFFSVSGPRRGPQSCWTPELPLDVRLGQIAPGGWWESVYTAGKKTWNPKLAVWKMTFPFQLGDVWFHAIFFRDFYQQGSRRKVYRFDFESPLLTPKNLKSIAVLTTEKPMVCLYWGWFRSWCPKKCQFAKESCRKELTKGLSIRAWLRR